MSNLTLFFGFVNGVLKIIFKIRVVSENFSVMHNFGNSILSRMTKVFLHT